MSRRASRARRNARKIRAPSRRFIPKTPYPEPWGSVPGVNTEKDWARLFAKYRDLRMQGGVKKSFVSLLDAVFEAKTPADLNEAVRRELLAQSMDTPEN